MNARLERVRELLDSCGSLPPGTFLSCEQQDYVFDSVRPMLHEIETLRAILRPLLEHSLECVQCGDCEELDALELIAVQKLVALEKP